jgi:hypothetical protein
MNKDLITAMLAGFFRQLLYVGVGVVATYINSHPEVFGVSVNWQNEAAWISNAAALLAFVALSWFSAKSKVKLQQTDPA